MFELKDSTFEGGNSDILQTMFKEEGQNNH